MSIPLSTLVNRLKRDIPIRNGTPDDDQITDAIKDAVSDFSRKLPLRKFSTMPIVAGTDTYNLPADFYQMVSFPSALQEQGLLNVPQGLIPVSDVYREEIAIAGGQLTIIPTPNYSMTREYWYDAIYLLSDSNVYTDMDQFNTSIAIKKASAICFRMQANHAASEEWSYQIGDERVDKKGLSKALAARASELESEYLADIATSKGSNGSSAPYGRRSDYSDYLVR